MHLGLSACALAIALCAPVLVASGAEWERGISLELALKAADSAAGFPGGRRPDNYDVTMAKLVLARDFRVENEVLPQALKDMESLSSPKFFWLITYRRWPPRLDDELVVFINAETGGVIRVYRTNLGKRK